ncbi:MAG: hypothetical protein ACI92S_000588 [Planctomycetaceae bacterium]
MANHDFIGKLAAKQHKRRKISIGTSHEILKSEDSARLKRRISLESIVVGQIFNLPWQDAILPHEVTVNFRTLVS